MSEQHEKASKLHETKEVFDVVFPSCDQSAVVLHPGKDPLDLPSTAIAAQRASVLRYPFALGPVGRDHLDAILRGKLLIEWVRVISLIADQPFWQLVEEASGQNSFQKPALGR